ncbi:TIR domain-containing protein [Sphingomicrobium marinum]|uniref:TIR domain-containing protein n=1 Tax=Sphingomicrobium marinum TaxID=1227950 RepID=UPI00223FD99C|nr:TIR domain-containing protein [Sphingomicrobium marinum]
MADIFLSYARADQARVEKLAVALEEAGYSLWWDRDIEGGHHFAKDIQRELELAKIIIVAWSKISVESHWVLDEAGYARDEGKLLPIALDNTLPPLGFRQVQALDFAKWPRDRAGLAKLTSALDRRLDRERQSEAPPSAATASRRPIALVIAAILVIALSIGAWFFTGGGGGNKDGITTIAVLPFTNAAGDQYDSQRESYPAAIIDGLSHIPDVDILSARTSFATASDNLSSTDLAERLGADYLIEGDLQQDGNSLRATTRLIDGKTGRPVWADSRSTEAQTLPELQRQSIRYIAAALQGYLGLGLGHLPQDSALSGEALNQYRRGMTLMLTRSTQKESVEAYNAFKRATELSPNSADAHAGLAYALTQIGPFTLSMDHADFTLANRAAHDRALELDPDSLFGLTAKAETVHKEDGDITQALDLLERVFEKDPDFGPAHTVVSDVYSSAGNHRAALEAATRAQALAPFDDELVSNRFGALRALGRYTNIRNEALACTVNCGPVGLSWLTAMAALVPEKELDEELFRLTDFASAGGLDDTVVQSFERYIRAVVTGRPFKDEGELFGRFYETIYHLNVSEDDEKLAALERFFGRMHAGSLHSILNGDRFTPPPHIRAHPRYHALFDIPKYKAVAEYRRERGITAGLPISPEEVAAEETRMREPGY